MKNTIKFECRNSATGNVSRTYDNYEDAHSHAYRFEEEVWEVSENCEKRLY